MIENYLQNEINEILDNCKIIDYNMCPTKYYTFSFEGWDSLLFTADDDIFIEALEVLKIGLNHFIIGRHDKYAFTEPNLCLYADRKVISLKIGVMELALYDEIIEQRKRK